MYPTADQIFFFQIIAHSVDANKVALLLKKKKMLLLHPEITLFSGVCIVTRKNNVNLAVYCPSLSVCVCVRVPDVSRRTELRCAVLMSFSWALMGVVQC